MRQDSWPLRALPLPLSLSLPSFVYRSTGLWVIRERSYSYDARGRCSSVLFRVYANVLLAWPAATIITNRVPPIIKRVCLSHPSSHPFRFCPSGPRHVSSYQSNAWNSHGKCACVFGGHSNASIDPRLSPSLSFFVKFLPTRCSVTVHVRDNRLITIRLESKIFALMNSRASWFCDGGFQKWRQWFLTNRYLCT